MKNLLAFVLLTFTLVSATYAASTATSLPTATLKEEQNKAVAKRVFEEILNQGKFQIADEIYARDFVNHGLHRDADLQEDQAAARWEKAIFPDLTVTADLMVAEGDVVTVVWTARGTNTGAAGGMPATGAKLEERGITVWRFVDGKIREEWTAFDLLRVVRQFAIQLKWKIMGLLGAVVILVWMAARFIRKLGRMYLSRSARVTS
jgi:steroid delta-isomerase-like uncharacterized protein